MTNANNNRLAMSDTLKKSKHSTKPLNKINNRSKENSLDETRTTSEEIIEEQDASKLSDTASYEAPTTTKPDTGDELSSSEQVCIDNEEAMSIKEESNNAKNDDTVDSTTHDHLKTKDSPSQNDSLEKDSKKSEISTTEEDNTNLIINYLPQNMTQDQIKSIFAKIGQVISCKLIKDKNTSQNLGYGFVKYQNVKEAEKALATLNGYRVQNKNIKVSLARPSCESIKGANLYISGLPRSLSHEELEEMFSVCGKIITSRLLYDNKTGISRGVGFVRFDTKWEAEEAIKQLNGTIPKNCTQQITVKLANSPLNYENRSTSGKIKAPTKIPMITEFNYHTNVGGSGSWPCNNALQQSLKEKSSNHQHMKQVTFQHHHHHHKMSTASNATQQTTASNIPSLNSYNNHHHHGFFTFPADFAGLSSNNNNLFNAQVTNAAAAFASIPGWQNTTSHHQNNNSTTSNPATTTNTNPVPTMVNNNPSINNRKSTRSSNHNHLSTTSINENTGNEQNHHLHNHQVKKHSKLNYSKSNHSHNVEKLVNSSVPTTTPTAIPLIPRYDLDGSILIPMSTINDMEAMANGELDGQFCPTPTTAASLLAMNTLANQNYLPQFYTLPHPNHLWAAGFIDPACQSFMQNPQNAAAYYASIRYPNGPNGDLSMQSHQQSFLGPQYTGQTTGNTNAIGQTQPCSLFAYNLAGEIEESLLFQLFSQFGYVRNIKIIRDSQNIKCKGYAFITMGTFHDAIRAIQGLNGYVLHNRQLQVDFKLNQPYHHSNHHGIMTPAGHHLNEKSEDDDDNKTNNDDGIQTTDVDDEAASISENKENRLERPTTRETEAI